MGGLLRKFLTQFIKVGDLEVETASGQKFRVGDGTGTSVAVRFKDAGAELRLLLDPESAFGDLFTDGRLVVTRGSIFDALMIGTRNVNVAQPPKWLVTSNAIAQRCGSSSSATPRPSPSRTPRVITTSTAGSTICFSTRTSNTRAPISSTRARASTTRNAPRSVTSPQSSRSRPARACSTSAAAGGAWASTSPKAAGAKVTGITLASEQLAIARERAEKAGLSEQAKFELIDYRDIASRYDRIVSVGMFEHVGQPHYDEFFRRRSPHC